MDHEIDGFCIFWQCLCGTPNTDFFNWTAAPTCAECCEVFDWSEILDQDETNGLLGELSPDRYQHLLEMQAA